MARSNYPQKQRQGLVPHRYPDRRQMRGVWPPVSRDEMLRHQREAAERGRAL